LNLNVGVATPDAPQRSGRRTAWHTRARMLERSYSEALWHAWRRLRTNHRPVGVGVQRCRPAADGDRARAAIVITNGLNHCAPEGSVLVPSVRSWVEAAAIEEALELRALCYPRLTAMRNLSYEVDQGSVDVFVLLEQIRPDRAA
jgi:hypothetical protein